MHNFPFKHCCGLLLKSASQTATTTEHTATHADCQKSTFRSGGPTSFPLNRSSPYVPKIILETRLGQGEEYAFWSGLSGLSGTCNSLLTKKLIVFTCVAKAANLRTEGTPLHEQIEVSLPFEQVTRREQPDSLQKPCDRQADMACWNVDRQGKHDKHLW